MGLGRQPLTNNLLVSFDLVGVVGWRDQSRILSEGVDLTVCTCVCARARACVHVLLSACECVYF